MLNGRVRNGNGCGHLGMVTGKSHGILARSASKDWFHPCLRCGLVAQNIKKAAEKSCVLSVYEPRQFSGGHPLRGVVRATRLFKERINAVKRLAVSTG